MQPFAVDMRQRHRGRAGSQGRGASSRTSSARWAPPRRSARPHERARRAERRARVRPLRRPLRARDAGPRARRARGAPGSRRARTPASARELDALLRRLRRAARRRSTSRRRLSEAAGSTVYLKREDLLHTGAHKINNALGQALLARRMGKRRVIAETGAGQHGVATATACALLGLDCVVYMGTEDMRRQRPNVERMGLLGAEVRAGGRRRTHAQGGGQRGHPRLGGQRGRHPLRDRLGGRPRAVPGARARPPARDRRRAARSGARPPRAGCPTG